MPKRSYFPMPFGTVYLIDPQLTAAQQRRDLEHIASIGMNTVVLWPAATRWDAAEPGGLAFETIDRVMNNCADLGLRVIIELQGQMPHQEMAPQSGSLTQKTSPRDYHWNDPAYQAATCEYMRTVAEHFRGHPALWAYDVFNECGCDNCNLHTRRAFARYLAGRYDNDITTLNAAWGTHFPDFAPIADQPIECLRAMGWWSVVPMRDWFAFRHQNFADLTAEWVAAVRETDPDPLVFADAILCDTMADRDNDYYGVNDWDLAERGDLLGLSCYANMLPTPFWQTQAWAWPMFWHTADAAARGKPVMVSEMMTPNRTLLPTENSSMTDELGLWTAQAFFHGIDGLIYWKWRPFRRGVQVGGRGLTDNNGTPNELAAQAKTVVTWVSEHGDRLGELRPDHAGLAILHDHNTQHLFHSIGQTPENLYLDSHAGFFQAFWERGINATFLAGRELASDGVPNGINVLVVPCDIAFSQLQAEAFAKFLQRGGTLLTESRFGLLNQDGTLWDHAPGGGLCQILGLEEKRLNCRFVGRASSIDLSLEHAQVQDRIELAADSQVLLACDDGTPLLVRRGVGEGTHIHSTLLLGQLLRHEHPGAAEAFDIAFDSLEDALKPAVSWQTTGQNVDISTLIDANDYPGAIGITNYQFEPVTIHVETELDIACIAPTYAASVEGRSITVPARTAALLVLKKEARS